MPRCASSHTRGLDTLINEGDAHVKGKIIKNKHINKNKMLHPLLYSICQVANFGCTCQL